MYRQGDLLFVRVNEIPESAETISDTPKVKGKTVIEFGEGTGHAHIADVDKAYTFNFQDGMINFIEIENPTEIVHDVGNDSETPHNPITLPKGKYQIFRQREDSLIGRNHNVID